MNRLRLFLVAAIAVSALAISCQSGFANESGWYPYVIARGQDRAVIENTPIELRPNRPFHFYGNSVRRVYYRGNQMPRTRSYVRRSNPGVRRR